MLTSGAIKNPHCTKHLQYFLPFLCKIQVKSNSNTLAHAGGQSSSMRRYAILVTIGALAAWQVYLTLKLQVLLT